VRSPPAREDLPYRRAVGAAVFNTGGQVFIGRRLDVDDDEEAGAWQMPQGGLDPGEDPLDGARRELLEETGISSVTLIAALDRDFAYDLPDELLGRSLKGKYRGQRQHWFAFRFQGTEAEIDVGAPGGHKPEFSTWRWARLHELPDLVVPFKRGVYLELVAALDPIVARLDDG
jgi:putative (di)nucleoside polyphosphate hydrolase